MTSSSNFIHSSQVQYLLKVPNIYCSSMAQIPDDPTVVPEVFKEMKVNMKDRRTYNVQFRKNALKKIIQAIDELKAQFDDAQKKDLGINQFMANFGAYEITKGEIKNLIDNVDKWSQPRAVDTPVALGVAKSSLEMQPLGLALVLSAWNYPIYTALPQVAAAISAGNSVILKPSELAPHCSKVLAILFNKYLDQRFYRCIEGKVEVAKKICTMPFDIICFTGSTMTGRSVAIEAAKNLTPCLLQLGGKCPVIVDSSANITNAAMRILFGKYFNGGQTCVGVDHVYVHSSISSKFKQELLKKAKQFYGRKDLKTCGDYAKIINAGHMDRLQSYLSEDHGGKILLQGEISKEQRFISPIIIEEPRNSSLMMKEEIFGPILPIKFYDNNKFLLEELNSQEKPLVVYMFSSNEKEVQYFKNNTSSGAFVVNDTVVQLLNPHLPFGGVGGSGYGRYHGIAGFEAFSNPRSICETKPVNIYPLSNRFPPYTDSKKRMMTFLLKVGGLTYQSLGKGFKVSLLIAAGLVYYKFGMAVPHNPRL